MTNAGWYPDPAGSPDTYRYWDGQSWSQMTTSQPPSAGQQPAPQQPAPQQPAPQPPTAQPPQQGGYGAVPSSPTPTPAPGGYGGYGGQGGYGQQPWSPQPTGGGGNGKTIGIILAAVLVLVLLGVGGFFGVRALSGDDGDDKANDDPSKSESTDSTEGSDPTEGSSSTIKPTGIQCTGGTGDAEKEPSPDLTELKGGGLTIPRREGYTIATGDDVAFSFPDAFVLQYVDVEEYWISLTGVGGLAKANGFDSVDTAAEVIVQCLTSSDRVYSGFTERTDLKNESIDIDGKPAHRITAEVRVEDPRVTVEGDVLDVIVVDTGDPETFGLYIAMAAIGDDALIAKNEDTTAGLSVD